MPKKLKLTIGGITIDLGWKGRQRDLETPPAYQPFAGNQRPDLCLELRLGFPDLQLGDKIFDSAPVWSLHRNGSGLAIKINHDFADTERLLTLPGDQKPARLYFAGPDGNFLDPFFGPTMELLMINYLARGNGVIIHACGIDCDGTGILFAGESGAGKSTLANLWDRTDRAAVLSDDRTLVRSMDGELRMFGTPWHGEAQFGAARGIRLKYIFFLHHGQKNQIQPLTIRESVQKLLQCSFPPYWDTAGMQFSMQLFEEIAVRVPCQQLAFEPDGRVIDFVKQCIQLKN